MTQPAARITKTPATKTSSTPGCGFPAPAIHNPHSAGHMSSQVPMGRSSRASSAYSSMRRWMRYKKGASRGLGSLRSSSGVTAAMTNPRASQTSACTFVYPTRP